MHVAAIAFLSAIFIGAIVVIASLVGAAFGAIGGFIVGWAFDETSIKILTTLGIDHLKMWEIGAALGFVGAFFRASFSSSDKG